MSGRQRVLASWRRTMTLARAEVLHLVRDRATLAQIVVVPLVQLLVLSNAATFAIRETPMWVVDQDLSADSRELASHFSATGLFNIVGTSTSEPAATDALLAGRATLVLTIPHGFTQTLVRDDTAAVHLDVNAEKGSAAGVVQSYAMQVIAAFARERGEALHPVAARLHDGPASLAGPVRGMGRIELATRALFNPELDYRIFMVPAILTALVSMIGTLIAAQNIAREREMGTIEQLNVTPIGRAEFIVAKLLPFWVLAMLDLALGLLVGKLVFGLPMRGSLLVLFGAAAVYLVAALAIGLWISTVVETQQQAMFVTFFLLMIYLLMGGLFTPVDSMPRWVQLVSEVNPVRHFAAIMRGVLLKGAGLEDVLRPLAMLVLFATAMLTISVRRYRKHAG